MDDRAERALIDALRQAGAAFAFVFGSSKADSDVDVAAWWPGPAVPAAWDVTLPAGLGVEVDLLVLNGAPLELAGRVAMTGRLLFDDDPPARVTWQATTRKIYLDEEDRQRRRPRLLPAPIAWLTPAASGGSSSG